MADEALLSGAATPFQQAQAEYLEKSLHARADYERKVYTAFAAYQQAEEGESEEHQRAYEEALLEVEDAYDREMERIEGAWARAQEQAPQHAENTLYEQAVHGDSPQAWATLITALPDLFAGNTPPRSPAERTLLCICMRRLIQHRETILSKAGKDEKAQAARRWFAHVFMYPKGQQGRHPTASNRTLYLTYVLCRQYVIRVRDRTAALPAELPASLRKVVCKLAPRSQWGTTQERYKYPPEPAAYALAGHLWGLSPATVRLACKAHRKASSSARVK